MQMPMMKNALGGSSINPLGTYQPLAAFDAGRDYCTPHVSALADVRVSVLEQLRALGERIVIPEATGAFYFLVKVDTAHTPMELVERLVREHGVAVIPGSTFGIEDVCTLRIAYAALDADGVAAGVSRLVSGLRTLLG